MLLRFLLIAVTFGFCSADWRSQCQYLRNADVGPFLYHSQSDVAVLAFYDPTYINFNDFERRKRVTFDIVPICFVKGYVDEPNIQVISGTQQCHINGLGRMMEYPYLFYLKKQQNSDKWILLNGGEYKHIVNNRGILFGLGRAGRDYTQMCGVTRRRTAIDEGNCRSMKCKSYCSYKVSKPGQCLNATELLRSRMPSAPKPVPAVDPSPPREPEKTGGDKTPQDNGYEGNKMETNDRVVETEKKKDSSDPGGKASGCSQPLFLLIGTLSMLCLFNLW